MHSGEVARKIGVAPRLLGRMTGNVWVSVSADTGTAGALSMLHVSGSSCALVCSLESSH
jgi:hypothetical protein